MRGSNCEADWETVNGRLYWESGLGDYNLETMVERLQCGDSNWEAVTEFESFIQRDVTPIRQHLAPFQPLMNDFGEIETKQLSSIRNNLNYNFV